MLSFYLDLDRVHRLERPVLTGQNSDGVLIQITGPTITNMPKIVKLWEGRLRDQARRLAEGRPHNLIETSVPGAPFLCYRCPGTL
jgi:hypothetical protein